MRLLREYYRKPLPHCPFSTNKLIEMLPETESAHMGHYNSTMNPMIDLGSSCHRGSVLLRGE